MRKTDKRLTIILSLLFIIIAFYFYRSHLFHKPISVDRLEYLHVLPQKKETFSLKIEPKQEPRNQVKLKTIKEGLTKTGEIIFAIEFAYDFKDRDKIYIEDLGLIPARGEIEFLTQNPQIEFRESKDGRTLEVLPVDVHSLAEAIEFDIPQESEFSEESIYGNWESPSESFVIVALKVLSDKFKSGVMPYKKFERHYIRTSYTFLKNLPGYLEAKIAVLVSYPHKLNDQSLMFCIQYRAIEKRRRSSIWREIISKETNEAKNEFLTNLKSELESVGKRK